MGTRKPMRMTRREALVAGVGVAAMAVGESAQCRDGAPQAAMVTIPAGPFPMGTTAAEAAALAKAGGYHPSWLSGEVPQRIIELAEFAIMKYPVTCRQYAEFCAATGHPTPWQRPGPPDGLLDHPVVGVNLSDAQSYARWAGLSIPTEAQWEKAARGPNGLVYPWGNRFDPSACQWNQAPTTQPPTSPVAAHPRGASPYGVMDMVGNAAEWCRDSPGPGSAYIKGGCWWTTDPLNLRPAARNMSGFANNPMPFYGFRCIREVTR